MPGLLDTLLLTPRKVAQGGVMVIVPQPTATQSSPTPPDTLNFVNGVVAYNPNTNAYDISTTSTGPGGQGNSALVNGLNSNIPPATGIVQRVYGPSGAFSIGGWNDSPLGGQQRTVVNTTSQPLTIVNEDTSTGATGRIDTQSSGAPIILQPKTGSVDLRYDTTDPGGGGAAGRWVVQNVGIHRPTTVLVDDYGADVTGAALSSAAFTAAHDALPASGGEIRTSDGATYMVDNVTFTKPVRLKLGRTGLTQKSGSAGAMFTTNNNLDIEGHNQLQSTFAPATGCTAVALTGAFSQTTYGTPSFVARKVGFTGGAYGIDTNGLTSPTFASGLFLLEHVRFASQSQIGCRLKSGVFFTYANRVVVTGCVTAGIWVGSNTETKFKDCVFINTATGPGLRLVTVHHVSVEHCQFYGTAGSSQPSIIADGIFRCVDNKFGEETIYVPVSAFRHIVIQTSGNPVTSGPFNFTNNQFDATRAILLSSVARNGTTATVVVDLAAIGVADMGLQTGDKVWITGSAGGDLLAALSGGPFTITRTNASTFTYTCPTGSTTSQSGVGFVALANQAAITLATPSQRATFAQNNFDGFAYAIDDSADLSDLPNDTSGHCDWDDSNTLIGPVGYAAQAFMRGGAGFNVMRPTANSPELSYGADARLNETTELRNRIQQDSEDLTHWGALGVTVTTGQTDPFGGTRACKIARAGSATVLTSNFPPVMGEGLSSGALDTTGSPTHGFYSLWAKQGPSGCGTMLVWLQNPATVPMMQAISLGTDWKEYRIPFAWSAPGDGTVSARCCPGGNAAMAVDALVFGIDVSDVGGDYLPALNGAPSSDTAAGNRWEKQIISAAGIKGGGANAAVQGLPLAPSGSISLTAAASGSGTLTLSPAQYAYPTIQLTGSTASGGVTVVFPSKVGTWLVDTTGWTAGGHTITLQANSNNWGTTISAIGVWLISYSPTEGKLRGVALTA